MKTAEHVFTNFQAWADKVIDLQGGKNTHYTLAEYGGFCPPYLGKDLGLGGGALPTTKNGNIKENFVPFVIQQIKEEIYSFVNVLIHHGKLDSIIEVGLGEFGGTRRIWIELFKEVYTIEPRRDLISKYIYHTPYDNCQIVNTRSPHFDVNTWPCKEFDVCFIDGDHSYEAAHRDYTKLEPYIKSGGIVSFHDSRNQEMGSAQFINSLRNKFQIKDIWHPDGFGGGISYYIKD